MNGTPQESTPPESALKKAADWVIPHWTRVRLGHEGLMLDKIQRQNRIVEIDAKNAAAGKSGKTADLEDWPSNRGDDAMGVKIGDEIHHHYPPPPEAPVQKTAGTLAKIALTAALLGTGAGGGVLVPWLLGAFGGGDKPTAVDTDTQYELRLGPPETPGQD